MKNRPKIVPPSTDVPPSKVVARRNDQVGLYHVLNRGSRKGQIVLSETAMWELERLMFYFNDSSCPRGILDRVSPSEFANYVWPLPGPRQPLVEVCAHFLAGNHLHLYLRGTRVNISKFMQRLQSSVARRFNNRSGNSGAVFQGRFKIVPIKKKRHFWRIFTYILVKNARDVSSSEAWKSNSKLAATEYSFSSLGDLLGRRPRRPFIESALFGQVFPDEASFWANAAEYLGPKSA